MGKALPWVCALALVSFGCGSKESDGEGAKGAGSADEAVEASGEGKSAAPAVDVSKLAEGDWAGKALSLAMQHETCETRGPALETLAKEAEAAGQPAWAAILLANVAGCLAEADRLDEAMTRLTRAVDLGFSDCFYVRTDPQLKKLAGRDDFAALLGRIRTSPADVQEIAWQAAEVQAVLHDTNMMITENMNRVDGDMTQVPQSTIPTRATRDPAVLAGRLFLAAVQRHQSSLVMQSDQSRMSHNTNMNIIDNMGDGTGGGRASPMNAQQSRMMAQQRAQQRAQQVQSRAFSPGEASTEVVACSAIPD